MSAVVVSTAALAWPSLSTWRADLVASLRAGRRLVTLYGRADPHKQVTLTAVLDDDDDGLRLSRTTVGGDDVYHPLSGDFPALSCFEREIHEQTGLPMPGHPWLKPLRYEGQDQAAMRTHPFYKIEGKEVHEVAVGPIHAGVIEPGSFRFQCLGEQVHHLEIQLGYQHRGAEGRLLRGDPRRQVPLVETVAGDTSVAWAWAWCAAVEALSGCVVAADVDLARAIALELERVAMHLSGLSGLCADIGFLQGATTYGRLRTTAINTTMRLCGSRFGRGAVRLGTPGLRLPAAILPDVDAALALLRSDLAIINDHFLTARTVQHRLKDTAVLTQEHARALGVVGMAARSSGSAIDARQRRRGDVWQRHPIAAALFHNGDCFDRARLRIAEIDASLAWLKAVTQRPLNDAPGPPVSPLRPDSVVVAVVEGWRGEVVHVLETGSAGELVHCKVQDPSLRNWMAVAVATRGNEISDFPICNKSFDLSYCGNDL